LKVRIFALAKELDLDSKDLIQHCNDAGIPVKNSALASITPAERDVLLDYLKTVKTSDKPAQAPTAAVPVREAPADVGGKVRKIRTLGPLGKALRRGKEDEEQVEAEEFAFETPTEAVAEAPIQEAAQPRGAVAQTAAAAEAAATTAESEATAEQKAQPADAAAEADQPESDEGGEKAVRGISREDYVAPGGVSGPKSGGSTIREMKPLATIRDSSGKSRRERKSSLPSIAPLPNFKPPSPGAGKSEVKAQKPDMPLTADILNQQSPLADILKKKAETKKRTDREETTERRPSRGGRIGLDDVRNQRRRRQRDRGEEERDVARIRVGRRSKRRSGPVDLKTEATVEVPTTVKLLSAELGRPARDIQGVLFRSGRMVTINQELDEDDVLEIGLELGVDITIQHEEDFEDALAARLEDEEIPEWAMVAERPPVVTILGHVDHGKTTLLDTIRHANVAAGEAGGITQHISSYQVEHNGKKITFVDTPGHEAFGEMRARGANVTDIIVLVVAADDGVMPQTAECISHAKAAGVPMIVAMNKIDLPDINEQRVLTELSQRDVLPVEWGGDTEVVRVSALQGTGIDDLLETILITAEINELKGPVDTPAVGVCLEAFRDEGRGPVAWLIVRNGTLRVGDIVLCGPAHGRIRAIYNDRDEPLEEAPPSTPIRVSGLDEVPGAGDHFFVMDDLDAAREAAEARADRGRDAVLSRRGGPVTLEEILSGAAGGGAVRELPLIIKADSPGSLEAIRSELGKFEHPEVRVKILHEGVGGVNESDVYLASSAGAIIVAFHVIADEKAQSLAEREGVEVRRYNIIYELTDHIRLALEGLLRPERVEVATGRALVLQTFSISRFGTIAGCRVLNGTIERNNRVHVIRDQKILNDYPIASLKREKDDVREVREGFECGIRLDGFNDVKEGDLLESYRIDEIKRTLT
jgi:translation initiation factor IF-2